MCNYCVPGKTRWSGAVSTEFKEISTSNLKLCHRYRPRSRYNSIRLKHVKLLEPDHCAYLCCARAERPTGWLRSLDCHRLELLPIRLLDCYQLELADSRQLELSGCRRPEFVVVGYTYAGGHVQQHKSSSLCK